MRQSYPPEELTPTESGTVVSRQILTPRGGFMARPGFKQPPKHAVVVRGGEAPLTDEIPVARASFLPPPPPSDPEALALSDKETLRAIPRRSSPPADLMAAPLAVMPPVSPRTPPVVAAPVALDSLRPVMESLPPPSDAPVMAGINVPRSRARQRSRWAIVAAAALGLMFGVVSVAMTTYVRTPAAPMAAAPAVVVVQASPTGSSNEVKTPHSSAAPSSRPEAASSSAPRAAEPPRAPVPRKTIF